MKSSATTYKYKFSFVMAVYNAEEFLRETVESILAQSMDFAENCEIIFVNDGSPDNCEEICLSYKSKYPNNITYIKQKNEGVSIARNKGIDVVRGKYVSFLDSDDKLSPNTLDAVYTFLEENYTKVDFASIKIEMFEAATGDHSFNQKFGKTRIVDVKKEYTSLQFSAASSFIKAEALQNGHRFDERIKRFAEDLKFMTELVLDKEKYGVVSGPVYYYRRRNDGQSSTDVETSSRDWYGKTLKLVHEDLIKYSLDKYGHISRYLQFVIVRDLQRRFKRQIPDVLSDEEKKEYKKRLFALLQYVDDSMIMKLDLYIGHRLFMLGCKYDEYIFDKVEHKGSVVSYRKKPIYDYSKSARETVFVEAVNIEHDEIVLHGRLSGFLFKGYELAFSVGDGESEYRPRSIDKPEKVVLSLDEVINSGNFFSVRLPLVYNAEIAYHVVADDYRKRLPQALETSTRLKVGEHTPIGKVLISPSEKGLWIQRNTLHRRMYKKLKQMKGRK